MTATTPTKHDQLWKTTDAAPPPLGNLTRYAAPISADGGPTTGYRSPRYHTQDTKIRGVNLADEPAWAMEIRRRGHSVANAVLSRVAEACVVVHGARDSRLRLIRTYEPGPFLVDRFTADGISCCVWFRVRLRGRDRYAREARNRMTLRYGGPSHGYGRSAFPREFEKQEASGGFDVAAIAEDIIAFVATEKNRIASRKRERDQRRKRIAAESEAHELLRGGCAMVGALLEQKGVVPRGFQRRGEITGVLRHRHCAEVRVDFDAAPGTTLDNYNQAMAFLEFLTAAALALPDVAPKAEEPGIDREWTAEDLATEPAACTAPTTETKVAPEDAWLSWAQE